MNAAAQFIADAQELMRLAAVRQYELAARLGITPKHMNQLFKGKVRMTMDQADAIAAALGYRLVLGFTFAPAEPEPGPLLTLADVAASGAELRQRTPEERRAYLAEQRARHVARGAPPAWLECFDALAAEQDGDGRG